MSGRLNVLSDCLFSRKKARASVFPDVAARSRAHRLCPLLPHLRPAARRLRLLHTRRHRPADCRLCRRFFRMVCRRRLARGLLSQSAAAKRGFLYDDDKIIATWRGANGETCRYTFREWLRENGYGAETRFKDAKIKRRPKRHPARCAHWRPSENEPV